MPADARPQARKNRRRIRWNTLRIFSGRERRRCLQIVCRSRTALLGQTPGHKEPIPRPVSGVVVSGGVKPGRLSAEKERRTTHWRGPMDDQELVTNLNRVARNIETALNRLKESKEPMNASAAQLPLAKQYLADLKRMTEEGAHV